MAFFMLTGQRNTSSPILSGCPTALVQRVWVGTASSQLERASAIHSTIDFQGLQLRGKSNDCTFAGTEDAES